MEKLVDLTMTRLFQLAEYILAKCTFLTREPAPVAPQKATTTIRFSDEDKAVQTRVTVVEGDLFS